MAGIQSFLTEPLLSFPGGRGAKPVEAKAVSSQSPFAAKSGKV